MHVHLSLGLPPELLAEIESHIEGTSRNAKLLACVEKGYAILKTSSKAATTHRKGKWGKENPV
jgi:hypothetical protein